MARNLVSALQALPEYSGWQEDEIKSDISNLFSKNEPEKITKFTTALSTSLPEFQGWGPDEVAGNIKQIFGLQAPTLTPEAKAGLIGIENPDERVAAAVASAPPPGPAAEPTWREPGYQPKEQPIQPPPPPEPKLGIQPGAQPPPPPALEQPYVGKAEPAKLETPGEPTPPPPALLNQPSQEMAETSIQKRKDSVWREAINAYKAGDKTAILDNMILQAKYAGVDPEKIKEMADKYEAEIEKIRPETHGAADFAATVIPGFLSDLGRMTSSGLKGALAAAPAAAAISRASPEHAKFLAPLFMAAGLNLGIAEYWRRKGEAEIYLQTLRAGVDPKKADEISRYASIPYGLLANAQISRLLPKGAAEFISKNVSNRIAQNALSYGQHTLEASAIGASMQATSSIADELGKHLESGNAAPDVKTSALEVLKETKDAFLSAIPSMAVLALPGAVAHVAGARAEATPEVKAPPVENVNAEVFRQEMLKDLEKRKSEAPKPEAQKGLMPPTVPLEEVAPKVEAAPPAKPIKFETPEADIDRLTGLPAQNISMDRIGAFKIDPNVEILYLGLDYLKATNDVFGHDVGNDVLRSVGKLIRENFGDALSYGRIGGEEFYVALPVGKDHTEQLKQFIQSVPEKVQIDENGIKHPVTMSGGMGRGTIESEGGQQRVYADKLLYEAKERGRNQIVVDKNGERQYIIGKEGLEKNYVDRYKLRVLEEGARALLEKPDISPSERTALEGTIQAVQARREGLIQGKAAGEGINNEPGKYSGKALGQAGVRPVGTVAPIAEGENAGRSIRGGKAGKAPPVPVWNTEVTPPPPPGGIPPIPVEKAPGPVEATKAPPVEPEAAPTPVPPPEAPPVKPAPPPEAPPEAPLPVRTAVKGVFKKKPLPVDTAKADNYRKATDLGYRKRTPGEEMAVADIKDQTEAQKFNKIADDVVKAYENRDLWEPDRLGQIYKTWDESGFRNKIDDFDVIRKANGISDALKRDGYDSSGNTIAPSKLDAAGLNAEARDALRAQGKVGKDEWHQPETWAEMTDEERKAILKKETYTATEFQKEIERIKAARAKDEISVTKRAEETVAEAALGGISKRMATAASERAGLRLPEDIETAQAKAKQRREKLLKENPEGDMETGDISADEMNDFLRKINYGDAKDINYYSKGEKPAGEGPTVEKAPEAVTGEWEKSLKDYYGDNRPASVNLEVGKTKIDGSAWAENEKGQISIAKDGSSVIRIRQDLPVSELRSTIVHDLVGHFGIPEIVASDKNIWNIIVKEFEKDKALYRSGERANPRTRIFEDYKMEYAANHKAGGERHANLQMFHEWIARQVEGFDAREFNPTNRKVVSLIKAALKRLFNKLGITDFQEQTLDDAIRTSVKKMRERKGIAKETPERPLAPGAPKGIVGRSWQQIKDIRKSITGIPIYTKFKGALLGWDAELQRGAQITKNMQESLVKRIPDAMERQAIPIWIEASGDLNVMREWEKNTTDETLKKKYIAAINLSEEAKKTAQWTQKIYAEYLEKGRKLGILDDYVVNYVNRLIDQHSDVSGKPSLGAGKLMKKFRASKHRVFPTIFDAEQAGYKTMSTDIADLLPLYVSEFNKVVATRKLLKDLTTRKAKDGRLLAVPAGSGMPLLNKDTGETSAYVITPRSTKEDYSDYKRLDHHALSKWKWMTETEDGKPILAEGDLVLHPEIYKHMRNVLGHSAIKDWYNSEGTFFMSIPKWLYRKVDAAQGLVKQIMFSLSTFHWVQEGTHAIGHTVNPFYNIPHIDLVNNADHYDAALHGLKLKGDYNAMAQLREGVGTGALLYKIPGIGKFLETVSEPLFEFYIPGLKYKTYEHILERNSKRYAKQISADPAYLDNVKLLSAQQANAAYGHLNFVEMGRNPTFNHFLRNMIIAPDFLEARLRFAGQAAKALLGGKNGREQFRALAVLAVSMYVSARILNKTLDDDYHFDEPFDVVYNGRRYKLRSVPGDIYEFWRRPHQFISGRASPIIGRSTMALFDWLKTGNIKDYRGQPQSGYQFLRSLLLTPIPISFRGLTPAGNMDISFVEGFISAMGVGINRYSPMQGMYEKVDEWKKSQGIPPERGEFPPSKYRDLRNALMDNNQDKIKKEWEKLLKQHPGPGNFAKLSDGLYKSLNKSITGSNADDMAFKKSLSGEDKKQFESALLQRQEMWKRFIDRKR